MADLSVWPETARDDFLDFWYCRRRWFEERNHSPVAAAHYVKQMTDACGRLLDRQLIPPNRSMPKVVRFSDGSMCSSRCV